MEQRHQEKRDLIAVVQAALKLEPVTLDELSEQVMRFAPLVAANLTQVELEGVVDEIARKRIIIVGKPDVTLVDAGHKPWLQQRKQSIEWTRWDAYELLLKNKGLSPFVVDKIGERNDHILDLAGDPKDEGSWARRGLVIGDVQSGKTANYIALFNKAADAGYKIFILLSGSTNKLRKQTQARVDEGFIGIDTKSIKFGGNSNEHSLLKKIGIGLIADIKTNSQTNFFRDFSAAAAGALVHLGGDSTPTVFVIKKNKTVLKNLADWLRTSAGQDKKIQLPLMLLDDEADYASINTNPIGDDATAINKGIRNLLDIFDQSSYVGFTATPFANILIDDQQAGDLFPSNFITNLESPSNYFGPREMFADEGPYSSFLSELTDGESWLPIRHNSKANVHDLPDSLKEAVRVFFLVNAIRDLRPNQMSSPRSMLVNVSRFVKVQEKVHELLGQNVAEMKNGLKFAASRTTGIWESFRETFDKHFSDIPEKWGEVSAALNPAIDGLQVKVVNSKNNSDDWDAIYDSPRARIIAVGGDVLSRGLTLEGLSTSYFHRRSLAYDTLMQMGRWFGYRDGFEDLTRLWIDGLVADWYQDIADALDELKDDLKEMAIRNLQPKDFGLAVRCHPSAMLTVTARNKARSGVVQDREISVSDIDVETSKLSSSPSAIKNNSQALGELILKMKTESQSAGAVADRGSKIWTDVPQQLIGDFLAKYVPGGEDLLFGKEESNANDPGALSVFVKSNTSADLAKWDVVLMSGEGDTNKEILEGSATVVRRILKKLDSGLLYVGGSKMRLGGRSDLAIPLVAEDLAELKRIKDNQGNGKDLAGHTYRRFLKRPLLLVYPVKARTDAVLNATESPEMWETYSPQAAEDFLVGIHVAFPKKISTDPDTPKVKYMVNSVWKRIETISLLPIDNPDELAEVDEENN